MPRRLNLFSVGESHSSFTNRALSTAAAAIVGLLSTSECQAQTRANLKPEQFLDRYKASVSKFGGAALGECRGITPGDSPLNTQYKCPAGGASVHLTVSAGNVSRVALHVQEDIANPGIFAGIAPHLVAAMSSAGSANSVSLEVAAYRRASEQNMGKVQVGHFPGATCKFLMQRNRSFTDSSLDCEPK